VTATPEDQRAWTLYRKVIPQVELDEKLRTLHGTQGEFHLFDFYDAQPGQPYWTELTQWLNEHQQTLDLARKAAAKPAMGFVFGPGGSAYDTDVWPKRNFAAPEANPL